MSLTPQALRLLSREVVSLRSDPPEGVRVVFDEDDLTAMEGWVQGPDGTPYQGGYFRIRFDFGLEYPNLPPKCTMLTKIFHPNMSKSGEICVDTLKKGWKKEYGVGHVLVTIKCLLIYPNPESALDEEAGKQLLADYDGYCKYAKLITSIHATPKLPPPEFRNTTSKTIPQASSSSNTHVIPSTSTRPPNSTSSTTSSKPAPLQTRVDQEQSPVLPSTATMDEKALKPATSTKVAGGTKTSTAASKAKRGLKRL
ncbi:ubiquitin-conjugating enzyme/RWD-like protein [Naematelia encephala]|uniref:E2 ubiquitin-conjugating enzyme n=1 Tax=Naematelia encephala TaxID=71784 RepID=A0A1Y2ATR6_9TREE|nr:ubiquitin-conjugating enzyme/RWD-like protein [Naematelia encephala]